MSGYVLALYNFCEEMIWLMVKDDITTQIQDMHYISTIKFQ